MFFFSIFGKTIIQKKMKKQVDMLSAEDIDLQGF